MGEWFEDGDFWEVTWPFMFPPDRLSSAAGEVEKILELTGFGGRDVLDLCCGPGRHSIALAGLGYRVTGVDLTPFLLDRAKTAAACAGLEVEWVLGDMREFRRDSSFDMALSMFTSFGYFDDPRDDALVLENVRQSLRPGGLLLVDVMGKERLARVFSPTTSEELDDGTILIQRHRVSDGWSRIGNEWILLRPDGTSRTFRFSHSVYSGRELGELLLRCGFTGVELYGDLDGSDYGHEARRLVAVARRG